MTVMAHVPIKAGDEHNILILPSDLVTDFMSEALPPKPWQTLGKLVK